MSLVGKRLCIERVGSVDELKASFECRMSALEAKLDLVVNTCSTILSTCEKLIETHSHMSCCSQDIMSKMEAIEDFMKKVIPVYTENHTEQTTPVVLLPLNKPVSNSEMKAFTLNSEAECPEGSWLGDENNPEGRVRVQIPPTMLLHINEHSLTPEKMALTLLDCLFPREVLAVSNLSGKGKHSKQQLDPLLIYGIRCHLMYKFNITECDWIRIKQNIDSKCRSVWRRKEKGLSLGSSKVIHGFYKY
ncbi:hypothetical protein AAG570_004275 [Ranatra chinensis]|uniref:Protein BANP n=1 Tax=Ranatra chinensis TaxID=642074 RepID=A0ABD0Y0D0_9HEMI